MKPSTIKLGEAAITVDYGVTASAADSPVGPKFLRITDIQNGRVDWDSVPWCEADTKTVMGSKLESGDIVFARTGATTGKSFLIRECPDNSVFASYLIRLRLKDSFDARFVSHFFQTPDYWAQITKSARGVAQPGVNATTLKSLDIPRFPLSEQKRIAEILDRAEALRAKRRAALALLDELTQSIFLDMFGDPVSNPKGWNNTKTLAEVASVGSGITKGRRTKDPVRTVPYMAVVNVQDKMLDLSVIKTIDATDKEIDRYRLKRNDLLLTEGGDADKLGRGTLWGDELPECIHQNHIFRVRPETSEVTPLFLNWLVGGPRGKSYFLSQAKQTTGIATINMTQLKAFPMLLPPLKLQDEFSKRILWIEDMRSSQLRSLNELDQLFASLQHRAFRGEL